jgi:hypothetical protein
MSPNENKGAKDGANEWTIVGEMVGRDVTVGTGSDERGDTVRDVPGWAGLVAIVVAAGSCDG